MKRQYIFDSNADQEKAWQKLWNDKELTAQDQTRKGKLPLKPRGVNADVFLTSKGTIEVFCRKDQLNKVLELLRKKVPIQKGDQLIMRLKKTPLTYTFKNALFTISINLDTLLLVTILGLVFGIPTAIVYPLIFVVMPLAEITVWGLFGILVALIVLIPLAFYGKSERLE